jgi:hypothetical protein
MYVTQLLINSPSDGKRRWIPISPDTVHATHSELKQVLDTQPELVAVVMNTGMRYDVGELKLIVECMEWNFYAELEKATDEIGVYRSRVDSGSATQVMTYSALQDAISLRDKLIELEWKTAVATAI